MTNVSFVQRHIHPTGICLSANYFMVPSDENQLYDEERVVFFPLGLIFRAIGGIPVDRSRNTSLVDQMANRFAGSKLFHLAITPEGTRKSNPNWKKGFYFIALKAQVPIMLIGIDYPTKTITSTKAIMPTGDFEKDMHEIKLYFKDFRGKIPENFSVGIN